MLISTLRPVLNLGNFPRVRKVLCPTPTKRLRVVFDSAQHALESFKSWHDAPNLALFVPHENGCAGDNIAIFGISNMELYALETVISMDSVILDKQDVLESYDITIQDDGNDGADYRFSVDANYDSTAGKVLQERILVTQDNDAKVDCVHCYLSGSATLSMKLSGKFFEQFEDYDVAIKGNIKGNMDAEVDVLSIPTANRLKIARIFSKDIFNVQVGGFFSLTPQLTVGAGIGYFTDRVVAATTGFDFDYPINFGFGSKDPGADTKPTYRIEGTPRFTPHKPTTAGVLAIQPHIVPGFNLQVSVLGQYLNLQVGLDNSLEVKITLGSESQCPNEPFNIKLSRSSATNLELFSSFIPGGKKWLLASSGPIAVPCPFCNTCPTNISRK